MARHMAQAHEDGRRAPHAHHHLHWQPRRWYVYMILKPVRRVLVRKRVPFRDQRRGCQWRMVNVGAGPGGYGTYWSGLFVQNKQALTAVRWQDRQTYHAHKISNHTLLMVLDTGTGPSSSSSSASSKRLCAYVALSGHVVEPATQVPWMESVLSSHAYVYWPRPRLSLGHRLGTHAVRRYGETGTCRTSWPPTTSLCTRRGDRTASASHLHTQRGAQPWRLLCT